MTKQQLREKIDKLISDHAYEVYCTKDLPNSEQDKEQKRLHKIYKDEFDHLIDEYVAGVIPEKKRRMAEANMELNSERVQGYNQAIADISRRAGIGGDKNG